NVLAWSGQPHKADLSTNSPSILLSATSEALARLRVSDLTAAAPPHPVGHPSSSTRDSASRAVPSSTRGRRDGYREAGEWQHAGGDQRERGSEGLCPSGIPKTAQRSASGVLDHR